MTTGVTVMGDMEIRGTLQVDDGDFDCTGANVVLTSSATQTGRLGPVGGTAGYTGNLRIERYRLAGPTNWLLMGSPIQGRTVNHWQDDFITAGYPGSQFPNFDEPVGSNILWPSIRWYDEANTGSTVNDGLQGVSSSAQALSTGQGFAVWAGTGFFNTAAFTIDLGGSAPVIAQTPVTLPMSWTDTSAPTVDGWNLVSNPLPSPIAFDQIARGADVADFVTFYNPDDGNTAVYDISLGFGTNNATNTIQSMQGFFLKATGGAVTTTVDEGDKVNDNAGGMFGLTGEPAAHLRLRIASSLNTFKDEAIMVFGEGQPGADADDAQKYVMAHNDAPQIATLTDGVQMAINAYGIADAGAIVPLSVNVGVTGEYTISAVEVGGLELSCLAIEDLETGAMVSLLNGPGYAFTMEAAADPAVQRFMLHINNGPDAAFTADNSAVSVGQSVQFTAAQAASSYAWDFGDGSTSTEASPVHAWDAAGTYLVTLGVSDGLCSDQATTEITVELSTGTGHAVSSEHRAWATPQGIMVEHAFTGKAAVTVELLDATGRVAYAGRMNANRHVLPSAQLANGAWFVRLDNGSERVTLRVPLAR
ncbi:MAG: PKD domain-containing protein [Flavobacteriales bacterium]|nr:PKD domain-containing protein [Flavobacteriales bacterium]